MKHIKFDKATDLEGNSIDLWRMLYNGMVIPYSDGSKTEIYLDITGVNPSKEHELIVKHIEKSDK